VRRESDARALALVRAMGIPVIDVERAFAAHPDTDDLYACRGCHYSPEGYALAASTILVGLRREGR
jgi:hypothetical protein